MEAGGLRLLFDPILHDPHHRGVYELEPPRWLEAERLRPDVVLVSHAHPDHFDVRSLHALARLDPHVVVVTPDELVADVCERLGFAGVQRVPPDRELRFGDTRLVTTPSLATEPEWGAILEDAHGSVWNQVDTVLRSSADVRRVVAHARLAEPLALVLARWQPLLEIEAQVPGSLAFPFAEYALLLEQVVATGARAVVPSAAGQRHRAGAWLDALCRPVTEARFALDFEARAPEVRTLLPEPGDVLRLRHGETHLERSAWLAPTGGVHRLHARGPRPPHRGLEVPPVTEHAPPTEEHAIEAVVAPFVRQALPEALVTGLASASVEQASLGLEVVFASGVRAWTYEVAGGRCRVREGLASELDVLDVVASSALADVLSGARSWGDVLLAGELRASVRAYRVSARGVERLPVAPVFLYYALSYEESVRRATWSEVEAVLAGAPPPWARRGLRASAPL